MQLCFSFKHAIKGHQGKIGARQFYFIKRPFSEGAQIWLKLKNELNKVELKMAFGGGLLSNFLLYLPPV